MNETINKATGETIKYNRIGGTPDNPIYFNDPTPSSNVPVGNAPITMSASSMQAGTQPITVPDIKPNTYPATAIIASTTTGAQTDLQKAVAEAEAQQKAADMGAKDAQSLIAQKALELYNQRGDITKNQATLEDNAGIGEQRKILSDLNNQIADQQVQLRAEQDRIRTTGMSKGQAQQELNALEDTYGRRLADLAIRKSAAQGNIEAIQSDAERKTKLLLAPIDNALEYYKTFGQQNADYLTKKEQEKLSAIQTNLQTQKKDIETLQKAKADMITEIANNGGGKSDFVRQINDAKSLSDVYTLGARSGYVGSLDRTLKLAQISKLNADAQEARAKAMQNDMGILSDTQIKNLDASTQAKKLKGLADMKVKQDIYKNLVDLYGFEAVGDAKSQIDRAYADFKIAYKEAANLGALTGPDVGLIEEAVKPASGGIINYASYVTSGGKSGILSAVKQAETSAKREALTNYKSLLTRNPAYSQSEYVKTLIQPFATPLQNIGLDNLKTLPKGEIVETPEGVLLESLGNGQFTQL